MKEQVLKILQDKRAGISDNVHRANLSFRHLSEDELDQPYGHSESTCREIKEGYEKSLINIDACIEWVNNRKEN